MQAVFEVHCAVKSAADGSLAGLPSSGLIVETVGIWTFVPIVVFPEG
jgi:hypothetical protein